MRAFLDPSLIARTYRDPLAILVLLVDLLPIIAVLMFGWGATPLVALYWLENLVIGGMTILRMLGAVFGNILNLFGVMFLVPFFTLHYGMFCFGHGVFIRSFANNGSTVGDGDMGGLVSWALNSGQGMTLFVGAIILVNLVLYISDYVLKGGFRRTELGAEMFAPYGRIVTLHVAIILGAFIAIGTNEPLVGVLLLIFLRVVFGVIVSAMRQRKLDRDSHASPDDSVIAA